MTSSNDLLGIEIAVVGMAGRFPGSGDMEEFWLNIAQGKESISFFSETELQSAGVPSNLYKDPNYVPARGVLGDVDRFDAAFFGFSPKEAALLDPQHRLFLQTAWQGLEAASYEPGRCSQRVGVFASTGFNSYLMLQVQVDPDFMRAEQGPQAMLSNDKDFLATRVSYKLGLTGPSVVVQSACSSSLLAIHQACQSLLAGESDMVLAGGVTLRVPEQSGHLYQEGMINSKDGHCRPFDHQASGTVAGNGVGVVVLKRLDDAMADQDHIHAVIRGSAANNDGHDKVGYAAPSARGQSHVIDLALGLTGVPPETIGYVETHGSGTRMGDPIEMAALIDAFRKHTDRKEYCAVGSVKANIGHCDAAAGVAGFLRAALAVEHGLIPPAVNFEAPNLECGFGGSPFYVPKQSSPWPDLHARRRAGVSSFGMGGTNVHLVLEQAPDREETQPTTDWQVLCVSARTTLAHDRVKEGLRGALARIQDTPLADIAYSLHMGRRRFEYSSVVLARDTRDALSVLSSGHNPQVYNGSWDGVERGCVFMFSGQGAQSAGMGRALYEREPAFREDIDACQRCLDGLLDVELPELLFGEGEGARERLSQTRYTQPALFALEYALARHLMRFGLKPDVLIGHSIGEYVAATLASVMSLPDAIRLVAHRGRLIQELPGGSMLLVPVTPSAVEPFLDDTVSVAAINAPDVVVVSGAEEAVVALGERLESARVPFKVLRTSHAFHSHMMDPILEQFEEQVRAVRLSGPELPVLSNVTGDYLTPEEAMDPQYWVRHLRGQVRFCDGIQRIANGAPRFFIEVGPGQGLQRFASATIGRDSAHRVEAMLPSRPDASPDAQFQLLSAVGRLWAQGAEIDWSGRYAGARRRRVPMPTYPFTGESYWVDMTRKVDSGPEARENPAVWGHVWRRFVAGGVDEPVPTVWVRPSAALSEPVRCIDEGGLLKALICGTVDSVSGHGDPAHGWAAVWAQALPQPTTGDARVIYVVPREGDLGDSFASLRRRIEALASHCLEFNFNATLTVCISGLLGPHAQNSIAANCFESRVRSAAHEHPKLSLRLLDLEPKASEVMPDEALLALVGEVEQAAVGAVLSYHGARLHIRGWDTLDEAQVSGAAPAVVLVAGAEAAAAEELMRGWSQLYGTRFLLADDFPDYASTRTTDEILARLLSAGVQVARWADGATDDPPQVRDLWIFSGGDTADATDEESEHRGPRAQIAWCERHGCQQVTCFLEHGAALGFSSVLGQAVWVAAFTDAASAGIGVRSLCWNSTELSTSAGVIVTELASRVAAAPSCLAASPTVVVARTRPDTSRWSPKEVREARTEEGHSRYARPDLGAAYAAPITERQKTICRIWSELFEIESVGIHDNFFDLGGDSIMALKVLSMLETEFQVALPLSEVFNSPTVATQAIAVREYTETPMSERNLSPLVCLQTGEQQRPPVFCVHPAGGIVHCYIETARALGKEYPFYAFQHPGIDGKSGPYTTYEKMAELYIEAMRERQPSGPYFIAGWSFGGTVAYEMANQLHKAGEKVGMLALFDSPGPSALYNIENRPEFEFAGMMTFLSQALGSMFGAEINVPVEELRKIPPDQQLDYLISRAVKVSGSDDLGDSKEALERIIDIFELTDRGEHQFKPAPYPGKVHMYRVQDMADYEFTAYKNHPQISSASFGWDALCEDLVIRFVPGTHMSMIFPPNVEVLANKLRLDLEECFKRVKAST